MRPPRRRGRVPLLRTVLRARVQRLAVVAEARDASPVGAANSGLYAMLAGRLVGPDGQAGVEPAPDMFSLLLENVEPAGRCPSRRWMSRWATERGRCASSSTRASVTYRYLAPDRPATASGAGPASRRSTRSRASTAPLDFLKLDVEGASIGRCAAGGRCSEASDGLVIMFESDAQWCARRPPSRGAFDLPGRSGSRSTRGRAVPAVGGLSTRPALEGHALGRADQRLLPLPAHG